MKVVLQVFAGLLLFNYIGQAQDMDLAKKAFLVYRLDQSRYDKLGDAVKYIQGEPAGEDANGAAYYQLRGEIFRAVATEIITIKQKGLGSMDKLPKVDDPALVAFHAFETALQKAKAADPAKKLEVKEALDGISSLQSYLSNLGIYAYEAKKYKLAYENFDATLKTHEVLKANDASSSLDAPAVQQGQQYLAGLAAMNAGMSAEAMNYFEKLYQAGYEKPAVYESLYKLKTAGDNPDMDAAYKYLAEGRKKFPDEVSLLFAEINHFLKMNMPEELVGRLKEAIEKQPTNDALYKTLANVYDNLYQKESKDGNREKMLEYYNGALEYYEHVITKNPKSFDAYYSKGALYFNRAAALSTELTEIDNTTEEGKKQYDETKTEMMATFDKALPYLQKAESLDPNNANTLTALRQIYTRKDDAAMSDEMKKRLETVQNGGKNQESYFD